VFLQPGLCLIHRRSLCTDDVPEPGRVVGLHEVSEFVDDDVVDDKHGGLDQPPVEMDVILQGAGTLAVTVVNDSNPADIDTESAGVKLHTGDDLSLGPAEIPFPQSLFPFLTLCRRNQETLGELHLRQIRFNHLDAVLPPQIKRGFAADQFLPRRMGQVIVVTGNDDVRRQLFQLVEVEFPRIGLFELGKSRDQGVLGTVRLVGHPQDLGAGIQLREGLRQIGLAELVDHGHNEVGGVP